MKSLQQKASAWLNSSDERGHNTNKSKADAYIAGALAERERARGLINKIDAEVDPRGGEHDPAFISQDGVDIISEALAEYEGGE